MASAYIEYGRRAMPLIEGFTSPGGNSIHGKCIAQETLTISGTQANGTTVAGDTMNYARITTDTLCYVAVGSTPDTTAVAATSATSARRVMLANTTIDVSLTAGQKVSVKSAP